MIFRGDGLEFGNRVVFKGPGNKPVEATTASNEELPKEAAEVLGRLETEVKEIHKNADEEIRRLRNSVVETLDEMQKGFTAKQQDNEAIAVRTKIRELRIAHIKGRPNPGNLMVFGNRVGETFYFDVTGSANGFVWGSDTYTSDSLLSFDAVHAGVLKNGQRGIVRVTIVPSPEHFVGSERNGVTSMPFGPYPVSYRIRRPIPTDLQEDR
jgi:hypothetical protein